MQRLGKLKLKLAKKGKQINMNNTYNTYNTESGKSRDNGSSPTGDFSPNNGRVHCGTKTSYLSPRICLCEDKGGYNLQAYMPGVSKDGVSLSFEAGELTIVGERLAPEFGNRLYGEIMWADYRRVIELDPSIDIEKISAVMSQGILQVRLPKSDASKPRSIEVMG